MRKSEQKDRTSVLANVTRGFWDVHRDKNKTNASLWGWKRQANLQLIKFFLSSFQLFIASHKAEEKSLSTRGVKATFDWPLVFFLFTHQRCYFSSSSLCSSSSSTTVLLLSLASAPCIQIFQPQVHSRNYTGSILCCLSMFSEEWNWNWAASSHWT